MKAVVRYLVLHSKPTVGMGCRVTPLDHPHEHRVHNQEPAFTTDVEHVEETPFGPQFETKNTVYVPLVGPEGFATLEDAAL